MELTNRPCSILDLNMNFLAAVFDIDSWDQENDPLNAISKSRLCTFRGFADRRYDTCFIDDRIALYAGTSNTLDSQNVRSGFKYFHNDQTDLLICQLDRRIYFLLIRHLLQALRLYYT